jgi:hypothetical protein
MTCCNVIILISSNRRKLHRIINCGEEEQENSSVNAIAKLILTISTIGI